MAGTLASASGEAPRERAPGIAGSSRPRLLHLLGSTGHDPGRPRPLLDEGMKRFPELAWQRIILGYRVENGRPRWLTDDEIVEGVVRAIRMPGERSVIGTMEPWSGRP